MGAGSRRSEEAAEVTTWFGTDSGLSLFSLSSCDSLGSAIPKVIGVALWSRPRGGIVHLMSTPWGHTEKENLLFDPPKEMLLELLFTHSRPRPHKEIALRAFWFHHPGTTRGGAEAARLQPH